MEVKLGTGLLLVLSGPSGTGKTTLARRLIQDLPGAEFSVSATTRARRGQEKEGVDYLFTDAKKFQKKIEAGDFVEWAEVHGHFYGSPRAVVDRAFANRSLAVFDIDVQGGNAIKRRFPDAILVFILPPSIGELERRLKGRKTDSEDVIRSRMLAARAEMERGLQSYDYVIVNDDVESAYARLFSIVVAESLRRGRVDTSSLEAEPHG